MLITFFFEVQQNIWPKGLRVRGMVVFKATPRSRYGYLKWTMLFQPQYPVTC
jgi:hypothetical protein